MHAEHFSFDVPRASALSRGLIFVKWIMLLPHYFILYFYGLASGIAAIAAWFAVLITGRYPKGIWDFCMGYYQWSARCTTYMGLLRDEYPPFGDESYPMTLRLAYPEQSSRGLLFLRLILGIPLSLWMALLGILLGVVQIISWFSILFTGNIPEDFRSLMVRILGYNYKAGFYLNVMTDEWPGFSIS